jgi:hypothetical protein
MKKCVFITMLTLAAVCFANQIYGQGVAYASLMLFTNGAGSISPIQNGQLLEVGQTYDMEAIPDSGFVFSSWQPVNIFTYTEVTFDPDGETNPPIISSVLSPVPDYSYQQALEFTMQPVMVILDQPYNTLTESSGWQANFVPVPEPSSIALIVYGLTMIAFFRSRQLSCCLTPHFQRQSHHLPPRTGKNIVMIPIAASAPLPHKICPAPKAQESFNADRRCAGRRARGQTPRRG